MISKRTPAPVGGLEDLQPDLSPVLNDSVLAVTAAVAAFVTFVDVVPPPDECIPETGGIEFGL